jgi:MFS family permease
VADLVVEAAEAEPRRNPAMQALRDTVDSLRAVFGQRALRRLELALAGSLIGDWAYATAVVVWAYGVGGAKAVGIWMAVRYVLMAITAPFAAALADHLPRQRVMIGADVARAVLVVAAAICVGTDTPAAPIYVLATLASMLGSVFRPAQTAWLPSLVDKPEHLTCANGVASTVESLSFFVGPAIGATLIKVTNVQTVFGLNAATFLWSAALVMSIRPRQPAQEAGAAADAAGDPSEPGEQAGQSAGALHEMFAGFREIRNSRDLRLIAVLSCLQTLVAGASVVYTVLFAVEIIEEGAESVGFIDSVFGVGALVGGFFAIARTTRNKLAGDLTVGVMLWSLPLLLIAVWPSPVAVIVGAIVMGFGNPLVDVNFVTVVQRITPDRVLGRVFGAFEGALIAAMAIGAAVMPFLDDWFDLRPAIAVIGLVAGVPALLLFPAAKAIDQRMRRPDALELLRSLPIFSPLAPPALDALARRATRLAVPAGEVVVAEGDVGDRFFVIETGEVAVSHGDDVIRHQGPGEYFGEIALLRDVPRTATVTATVATELVTVDRADFLGAVAGSVESATVLDEVVSYRIRF